MQRVAEPGPGAGAPAEDQDKPFNLLKWFALFSFATIATISLLAGLALSRFLAEQLLRREAVVSMEFIQSIYDHRDAAALFPGVDGAGEQSELRLFFESIIRIPDVIKANIFDADQMIVWSSDPDLVGKKFGDNSELAAALGGELVFKHEVLERNNASVSAIKTEHKYIPEQVAEFVESYIPIRDKANTKVVRVVELYKAPVALFAVLEKGRWLVLTVSVLSGLFLFSVLYWIVRRGNLIIEQQNDALVQSERLALVGSLARSIAHSIRNPLASIRSSAELLMDDASDDTIESLNDVIKESDRLDLWIRELLVLSQSQALEISQVSINEIVSQAVGELAARLEEKGIGIAVDLSEGLRKALAEPVMLKQIVITLLTNSAEASNGAGPITVETRDTGNVLSISIRDRGVGMTEEQLTDVFTPLVSGKPSGLGLGLTLAKQAVERFGGKLSLTSAVNAGTTATISLRAGN